jgi:hypothetical protein
MHAFSTLMGVMLGHKWAADMVTETQRLVTYFRGSHRPGQALRDAAKGLNITSFLATANQTRMTSVVMCLSSVQKMEAALQTVRALYRSDPNPGGLITKPEVLATIDNTTYWRNLAVLLRLLGVYEQIITAIQGKDSTLADVSRCFVHAARTIEDVLPELAVASPGPPQV